MGAMDSGMGRGCGHLVTKTNGCLTKEVSGGDETEATLYDIKNY